MTLPLFSFGQERNCATMPHLHQLEQMNPLMIRKMQAIERHTQEYLRNPQQAGSRNVITIPVVVHVVYRTSSENISDAQIQSQMTVINDDFRRLNSDADNTWSQAADVEIEFCLASVDPNGNATNGITRTATSVSSHGTNNSIKFNSQGGKDAWPAGDYLNMWVGNIGGGILGYAQFPGGSAATDGVVMDYRYFGTIGTATAPFDLGRTTTHEIGHWLNLRHIWGDGNCSVDDFVGDTPTSDAPNYGCSVGHVSCSSVDMVQNYMDYSDDACMNLFTAGQKSRMRALFAPGGFRESLLNSNGCGTPGGGGGGSSCASTVSSFPYAEGFESASNSWNQVSGDDLDWTRRSGGTPSSGTGPSAAAAGSFYMYIEASSPNFPSKTANLESPCFDLSGLSNPSFSFQYHMLGNAVGTLNLQASTDGTSWTTIWSRSADQGSSWNSASVDLTAYGSATELRLRFNGTTASSWQGDICIDDVSLDGGSGGGGGGGCADTEVTLTLVLDNYPSETSWTLSDGSGATVASGSGYSTAGATITETFCLPDDCYEFTINDSYGDGICCAYGNGSYSLDAGATNLASGGSFGSSETSQIDIGGACGGGGGTCPAIDFNSYTINSYGGTQDAGSFQVQDGGATLFIQNNAWKSIALSYNVTPNTVIEFDFASTIQGEIHGIGFDSDNGISSNRTFKVHGTQNWGITNYDNYTSGWVSYTIPVGSFYTGSFDRLFFVADHDGGSRNGTSFFRNVKIYEGSCSGARQQATPVTDIRISSGLEIFPNPVQNILNLSLPEVDNDQESQVVVYDLVGKQLMQRSVQGSYSSLDVSQLKAGSYLLSVRTGGETVTERFVVTK
jgi:hypothetical protein